MRRRGFTIIEILIVVLLIALMATGATLGVRAATKANLRSACARLVAASRFAYSRSVAQGSTVRIMLDLGSNEMWFEEGSGRVTLARPTGARRERDRQQVVEGEGEDRDEAGRNPWDLAREHMTNPLEPHPVASPFSAILGQRYARRAVGDRIRIAKLFVPHEPEPRERGVGAIYYFPAGQTEHAVVQLSDGGTTWSVEVHPLTGRARLRQEAYEPPPPEEDVGRQERSDSEADDR